MPSNRDNRLKAANEDRHRKRTLVKLETLQEDAMMKVKTYVIRCVSDSLKLCVFGGSNTGGCNNILEGLSNIGKKHVQAILYYFDLIVR